MRSAALLLGIVFLASGCGRTYTDAQVRAAVGARGAPLVFHGSLPFATWSAVTDLRFPSRPQPTVAYTLDRYEVLRFRSRDGAWAFAHSGFWAAYFARGQVVVVHANLLFVGEQHAVRDALARLH